MTNRPAAGAADHETAPSNPIPPSRQQPVTVSVLTYNRRETLRQNLRGLEALCAAGVEVLVIDNGSSDGTEQMVQESYPAVRLVRNASNMGVAGRNRGVQAARGEVVITLDDDVMGITQSDVQLIVDRFQREPALGGLCFKVVHHATGEVSNWCHHRRPEEDSDSTFITYEISEGAVAFRRAAFLAAGGYPESFFISHEGLELAYRLMNNSFEVHFDGRVVVRHTHDSSGRPTWRRYYYDTRNMIWVAVRNMPWSHAARYLFIGLSSTALYSVRDGFGLYWARAVLDALRDIPSHVRERQPWAKHTSALCAGIDRLRPGFWYMVKKRTLRKGISL